jgi:two-component system chemotaxis response regulator CheY
MELPDRPAGPRVLSVGQCGIDHRSIANYLTDQFGALVEAAHDMDDVQRAMACASFNLVLVNRVLDRDGSSGLDLIRVLKSQPELAAIPVVLVSDYPEAQAAARALGTEPGFGKAELQDPQTLRRIKALLGR